MKLRSSFFVLLLIVTLCSSLLNAKQGFSLRFAYGVESDSDLGEILSLQKPTDHKYHFDVLALDVGYLLTPSLFDLPLDLYIKGGTALFQSENLSKYPELHQISDINDKNIYEITLYIKLYYTINLKDNIMRIGFGEGGSYVNDYLPAEVIEAHIKDPQSSAYSKYLNYLDISFDVDLGHLFGVKTLDETYLGYTIKHRSGIFGLINNVRHGGSNYNTISIEKNF
ncbi:hypothetical protein MNB_SM-7-770 [hydrothermal vent metagenome]|uniref:Outer membrane protein beta-barrel domain-containing protein n=1 Tax=hydrothermal vent metagenome TaxID=652676 RepID=A0A1W1C3Z4_9ZZZZ